MTTEEYKKFKSNAGQGNNQVYDTKSDGPICWVCNDLHEEIKSLQKAEARSRHDIRNIIREELYAFFKREYI